MPVLTQAESDTQMTIIREQAKKVAMLADSYTTRRPDPATLLTTISTEKTALDAALATCTTSGIKNYNS